MRFWKIIGRRNPPAHYAPSRAEFCSACACPVPTRRPVRLQ
jgi:hypothetical protein